MCFIYIEAEWICNRKAKGHDKSVMIQHIYDIGHSTKSRIFQFCNLEPSYCFLFSFLTQILKSLRKRTDSRFKRFDAKLETKENLFVEEQCRIKPSKEINMIRVCRPDGSGETGESSAFPLLSKIHYLSLFPSEI